MINQKFITFFVIFNAVLNCYEACPPSKPETENQQEITIKECQEKFGEYFKNRWNNGGYAPLILGRNQPLAFWQMLECERGKEYPLCHDETYKKCRALLIKNFCSEGNNSESKPQWAGRRKRRESFNDMISPCNAEILARIPDDQRGPISDMCDSNVGVILNRAWESYQFTH